MHMPAIRDALFEIVRKFHLSSVSTGPATERVPLLAGVSGGADSMALLHILKQLEGELGYQVHAVHVNHGLRATADRDSQCVRDACMKLGVPFVLRTVSMESIPSQRRHGTEADARWLRYEAFIDVASSVGARVIYLAHHADDQVETLLWRLIRGTTLTGLGAMRPITEQQGLLLARPFLGIAKFELQAYVAKNGIPFVEDETNQVLDFTRNYIRTNILPEMKALQPELPRVVARLTSYLQEDDAFLEEQATKLYKSTVRIVGNECRIEIKPFLSAPRPLQRRAIKILLYCLAFADWTSTHVEGVLSLFEATSPSAEFHLPSRFVARREYSEIVISRMQLESGASYRVKWSLASGATTTVAVDGAEWTLECQTWTRGEGVHRNSRNEVIIPQLSDVELIPADTSSRLPVLGLNGTKKIQDIFVDAKIPRHMRQSWPQMTYADRSIWLIGLARSRNYLIQPDDRKGWLIRAARRSRE